MSCPGCGRTVYTIDIPQKPYMPISSFQETLEFLDDHYPYIIFFQAVYFSVITFNKSSKFYSFFFSLLFTVFGETISSILLFNKSPYWSDDPDTVFSHTVTWAVCVLILLLFPKLLTNPVILFFLNICTQFRMSEQVVDQFVYTTTLYPRSTFWINFLVAFIFSSLPYLVIPTDSKVNTLANKTRTICSAFLATFLYIIFNHTYLLVDPLFASILCPTTSISPTHPFFLPLESARSIFSRFSFLLPVFRKLYAFHQNPTENEVTVFGPPRNPPVLFNWTVDRTKQISVTISVCFTVFVSLLHIMISLVSKFRRHTTETKNQSKSHTNEKKEKSQAQPKKKTSHFTKK
ncbi:hypothetical protein BLNAU_20047 [Blattamonas nauphoetae]|uniref:Transmembrane protein n=1 Tax=Blattamonas nauphoetae TaxID=2049346 RepID=A0ABQ9WZU6_9EUKA|nr:hypothetical protein BLNAU_20047 [Blattamonas nauphoetae]